MSATTITARTPCPADNGAAPAVPGAMAGTPGTRISSRRRRRCWRPRRGSWSGAITRTASAPAKAGSGFSTGCRWSDLPRLHRRFRGAPRRFRHRRGRWREGRGPQGRPDRDGGDVARSVHRVAAKVPSEAWITSHRPLNAMRSAERGRRAGRGRQPGAGTRVRRRHAERRSGCRSPATSISSRRSISAAPGRRNSWSAPAATIFRWCRR